LRLLLLNQFYRPDVAATGQYLADLAEGLVERGHEVHVICSRRPYGGGPAAYKTEEVLRGVRIHRVGATGFGRSSLLGRLADYLSFYFLALGRAFVLPRMDVCVSLTTPPFIGLVGTMLNCFRGTRLVLWTMDLYPEVPVAYGVLRKGSILERLLAGLAKFLYRHAEKIISLGKVMTQRLIEAGADLGKIETIPMWVPGEVIRPVSPEHSTLRSEWGLNGCVVLMYSGNLGLGHDLDTFIRAIARMADCANLRAIFVGEGSIRGSLEALSSELGLRSVEFRPPQPLERLSDNLAVGDIHLVSQRPGTQGLIVPSKLYGILAAARPTVFIGPEDTEVAEILRDSGAGIIVAPGGEKAAADAFTRLVEDQNLRTEMGRRGRVYYEQHFGRDRSVSAIVKTIERASLGTV